MMGDSLAHTKNHLPSETTLHGRYIIDQYQDQTEETIIYKGRDIVFGETISIVEFYPGKIAYRSEGKSGRVTAAAGIQETVYTQAKDQFLRETRELLRHNNEKQGVGFIDYLEENGTIYRIMKYEAQTSPDVSFRKPQPEVKPEHEPEPPKSQPEPGPQQEKTRAESQPESDLAALKRARLEEYKRKMEEHRNKQHAGQSKENTELKENKEEPKQESLNKESLNQESLNQESLNQESLNQEFDPQQLSVIDHFFYNLIIWLMLKLGTKKQAREAKKVTLQNFFKKPALSKLSIIFCIIIVIMIVLQFPILTFIVVIYFLSNVWLSREK